MQLVNVGGVKVSVDPSFQLTTLVLVSPDHHAAGKQTYRATFVITGSQAEVPADALHEYVDDQVDQLAELPKFKQVSREDVKTAGGLKAVLQRHSFQDPNGVALEQLQLYLPLNKQITIGTATHLAGADFKKHEARFKEMLLSLSGS